MGVSSLPLHFRCLDKGTDRAMPSRVSGIEVPKAAPQPALVPPFHVHREGRVREELQDGVGCSCARLFGGPWGGGYVKCPWCGRPIEKQVSDLFHAFLEELKVMISDYQEIVA